MRKERALKRYPLDNSALFYPIMATKKAQSLFRITFEMKDEVDGVVLEEAVNKALDRFPTYKTRLKAGYAWHYLEENTQRAKVFQGFNKLLRPIDPKETNGYLFRFVYEGRGVYFEVFHGLGDGMGTKTFVKGVFQMYRQLQGVTFEDNSKLIDFSASATQDEIEDAFKHYYEPIKFSEVNLKELTGDTPQLIRGTIDKNGYSANTFRMKYADVSGMAKDKGASFSAFTAAMTAYAISKLNFGKKPIVVMVPVNLRAVFPSHNVRNFVTFVRLSFAKGEFNTFDDFVLSAAEQLKAKTEKDKLNAMLATTVRTEKMGILRIAPLWLKCFVARGVRHLLKSRQTIIVSNIGVVELAEKLGIENATLNINVSKNAKVNLGIVSVGDTVTFSFTKSITENHLPDMFENLLNELGIEYIK